MLLLWFIFICYHNMYNVCLLHDFVATLRLSALPSALYFVLSKLDCDHLTSIATHPAFHKTKWAAPSEFGTYRLCEQRRFRRACASAQSRQNLRCSLIQVVSQEEPSDRKPDPWPLWMAGHAQLKFVMTECSKTQIRLTGLKCFVLCVTFPFLLFIILVI